MFKRLLNFWNPFKTQYRIVLNRIGKFCPQVKLPGTIKWLGIKIDKAYFPEICMESYFDAHFPHETIEDAQFTISLHQTEQIQKRIQEQTQGQIVFYEAR